MTDLIQFDPNLSAFADHLEHLAKLARSGQVKFAAVQAVFEDEENGGLMYAYDDHVTKYSHTHELLGLMQHHQQALCHRVFYGEEP